MLKTSKQAEDSAVIALANSICAAIRTAPKGCGMDSLESCILTGEEKDKVSAEMRKIGETMGAFMRDAGNLDKSTAVVLVGTKHIPRGLKICGKCGYANCAECTEKGGMCMFSQVDLGIALGSAVSMAADARIDNRIMYTIGTAAENLGFLPGYKLLMGIPLSVSGKSPFFDRTKT
jgi:uncharacterized ferredoxin-like protein